MLKMYAFVTLALLSFANSYGQVNNCELRAQKAFSPIEGMTPLAFGRIPSTDLLCDKDECVPGVREGEVLTPRQAVAYYEQMSKDTNCSWDLSELNPSPIDGIWSETAKEIKSNELELENLDQVRFVSKAAITQGKFRMTVSKANQYFTPIQYTLIISKNVHNYLLRRNLLTRLGYDIPAIKYLKSLKIKFDSKKQKTKFIEDLKASYSGSLDRYILSEDKKSVVIQDIVAMEDQEFKLNLARGYVSNNIFEGKRIYKSLLIPYALTDVNESINMFDWTIGRIISENVALKYPEARDYRMTKDDALWMTKKIIGLSEKDWWQIVDGTHLPPSVKLLMFEKIKSRRNHLATLFSVDNINLKVNTLISNSDDLVNGKIVKEFYSGYARRFKISDPASPLSYSEMTSFIKSKGMTTGIELLVNSFNSAKFTGTDISNKVLEFNDEILAEAVAESITENTVTKTPVKSFAFPTVKGSLILNREVVAGSYLGTDNMIQLVDTVGASVRAGVFGGITGVYSQTGKLVTTASGVVRQQVPIDLSMRSNIYYNRTYSHVRPITTIQKAIKYPFKNLFVPYLKRKYGHLMDELMDDRYDALTIDQKVQVNKLLLIDIKKQYEVIEKSVNSLPKRLVSASIQNEIDRSRELIEQSSETFENSITYSDNAKALLLSFLNLKVTLDETYDSDVKCLKTNTKRLCPYNDSKSLNPNVDQIFTAANRINAMAQKHSYKLNKTEVEQDIEKVTALLDENLEVGESVIITDSLGASLGGTAGMSFYNIFKVSLDLNTKKFITGRLHFFRASEDEIHVYRDFGNVNSIEASLGVQAFLPILKITVRATKGKGRTKFYKVKIGELEDKFFQTKNHNRAAKLKSLRNVLMTGSTASLDKIQKPIVIEHKFTEKDPKIGILVWRWNWLKQADNIKVTLPTGETKEMYKNQLAYTKGVDYENYFGDLVKLLSSKAFKTKYSSGAFTSGNPGFTFHGKARNKVLTYEGIYEDGKVARPFVKLSHIVNGWKLKKDKAIAELRKLKKKYRFKFFEESSLAQTKEIFLYNINVNFFIYDTGIEHLLSLSDEELESIWKKFQTRDMTNFSGDDELILSGIKKFKRHKRKYMKFTNKNNLNKASRHLLKMVEVVDNKLSAAGILRVYGGAKNFMAESKIDGFRVGDENGDKALSSNSFGRRGEYRTEGPLGQIRRVLGITRGEFSMSWLLGRVI